MKEEQARVRQSLRMEENQQSAPLQSRIQAVPRTSWPVLIGAAGVIAILAFMLGFIPMWAKAKNSRQALETVERQQVVLKLQNALASSAIDARRGQYEPARQQTSEFYTTVNQELSKGEKSAFTTSQREGVAAILGQRDEVITLLARNDPASADRLTDLFVSYNKAVEGAVSEAKGAAEPAP